MIELHPDFLPSQGQPQFVVLSIDEFNRLKNYLDELEDLEDLLLLRQAQATAGNEPTISLTDLCQRLGIDEQELS
ncbi:type II toxin-antitoxin system Phd/YefM family antitoxin [Thiospirillum jenense]|uniref:Type II toxin-antitoxin system Phd/YefM family antitoxin n=1 Tax=Thiospirillum jenense TaxID=1653858 RepID=A0A839HK46_9GAMM|nr:type II toxin-antitoxin system Phd/YefM family antitoxin [Thiospirillum jenense]MBB1127057.1 type II toxin-antitoxin system Phd/YefM family antitoxin [Thiospirillum jenense]